MKQAIILFATTFSMAACGTRQSNLNRTIGWKANDPINYTVLYLKLNLAVTDTNLTSLKHKLDSAVFKSLLAHNLGDRAANDDPLGADMHFVVARKYDRALTTIVTVAESYGLSGKLNVYQRRYNSDDTWTDHIVYHVE